MKARATGELAARIPVELDVFCHPGTAGATLGRGVTNTGMAAFWTSGAAPRGRASTA